MREFDKATRIIMNKKTFEMIRDKWKEINMKPDLREIEIIYLSYDRLRYWVSYSDGEAIYKTEITSKCFFKKLFNHWIDGKKIMVRNDDDWFVLVKDDNE